MEIPFNRASGPVFLALRFYHGRLEMCLLVSLELYRVNRQEFGWCWCWEHYCHVFVCMTLYDKL